MTAQAKPLSKGRSDLCLCKMFRLGEMCGSKIFLCPAGLEHLKAAHIAAQSRKDVKP